MSGLSSSPESRGALETAQRDPAGVSLNFDPETAPYRTPFRDAALEFILQTAQELSGGRIESAEVQMVWAVDEPDSEHLDLVLTMSADRDTAWKLVCDIIDRQMEREKDLPDKVREDLAHWVCFGFSPVWL